MKNKEITIKDVLMGQLSFLFLGITILFIWKDEKTLSYLLELFSIQHLGRDLIISIVFVAIVEGIGFLFLKLAKLKIPNNEMTKSMITLNKKSKWNQFLMSISPGISEEILFRAIILAIITSYLGSSWGCVIVSLLFTALHIPQYKGKKYIHIYIFALSVLLSYTFILTGTLWSVMIIHTVHNFLALEYLRKGIIPLEEPTEKTK